MRSGLHIFALLTAGATFVLIIAGGLVTSTESGLAVPDWPLSYGMLMPPMVGGVFFEHGHRMVAGTVALLTLTLMVWLLRSEPRRWVKGLGVAAFGSVVLQAVLGGLTVIFLLPTTISVSHACLAQSFFCLTVTLALVTSPRWRSHESEDRFAAHGVVPGRPSSSALDGPRRLSSLFFGTVFIQLVLGAVMRHTGAGLAIPDFPLAFGRVLPAQWSAQIAVHFAHRAWALVVLATGVALICSVFRFTRTRGSSPDLRLPAISIAVLLPVQIALGAVTVLSGKQVAPATAHVATGALLLAAGLVLMIRLWRCAIESAFAAARGSARPLASPRAATAESACADRSGAHVGLLSP